MERRSQKLESAREDLVDAQRIINITAPLLAKRILEITGGDKQQAKDLMDDIANVAGNAARLAVVRYRVDDLEKRNFFGLVKTEHHPDSLGDRQRGILYGHDGARPIETAAEELLKK